MPFDREAARLEDIRDAILHAQEFIAGLSYEQFARDIMRVYATIRCLEIISEASRHLDPLITERHAELPWAQIAAAGNVDRHDYPAVRPDLVWATIHDALPPLLRAVEAELAADR